MGEFRKSTHAVWDIQYHIIWITKYRYKVLKGHIAERLRELLRQSCEAREIKIIRGSISTDHVHMLLSCPPVLSPSKIVQYLKGRSSKLLQDEFQELRKRYWGQHLWAAGYYCGTVGAVTEEQIKAYIENQAGEEISEVFKITE
jgi:putative transposase